MFTERCRRVAAIFASAIVLSIGLVPESAAQEPTPDAIIPEADKTPEEIVVYGETNVIILRNALYLAEESFFAMFNSLNSDDEFDVDCKKRQGSISQRRREHRCMPRFALKFAAQASSSFYNDMGSAYRGASSAGFANLEYQARLKAKEKEMWAEIVELAKSNPAFREEIRALQEANRALDAEKQSRGSCKKLFCRD